MAALDSTEKGHTGWRAYYTERGEKPGVWIGSGMAGIDGLNAGDPVTAEQMRALFGGGMRLRCQARVHFTPKIEIPQLPAAAPAGRARVGLVSTSTTRNRAVDAGRL